MRSSKERIARLDAIGFDWRTGSDQKWDAKFDDLVAYKHKFGHCDVPYSFKDDPALGHWVYDQRRIGCGQYYRKGKLMELNDDRRQRLEKIGFTFEREVDAWSDNVKAL
ncbi:MAG: helicase associated domain-containing protein, partial [Planctomycetes bacterium]|nr:helicase associated domain-containing protein [Planctomycetota bacterium]